MRCVYSAPTSVPVDVLRSLLESEGIECVVRNRHLAGVAGEVPPHETWASLWILDDEHLAKAERLVTEFLADDRVLRKRWECPLCGERIDGRIGACWRCAAPGDASGDVDTLSATVRERLSDIGDRVPLLERWLLGALLVLGVGWLFGWMAANQ